MDIVINGLTHNIPVENTFKHPTNTVSYETLLSLAGYRYDAIATVTYSHPSREGILTKRKLCVLEPGMIFNIGVTGNS
jgi:hypothetical protein